MRKARNGDAQVRRELATPRRRREADFDALARATERQGPRAAWKDQLELEAIKPLYSSLRLESLNTIDNRIRIMMSGLTATMAFIAGSLALKPQGQYDLVVRIALADIVPFICVYCTLAWLTEAVRCHRASYFIAADLEPKINRLTGRLSLTWETALWVGRLKRDERFGPSMLTLGTLWILGLASPILSLVLASNGRPSLEIRNYLNWSGAIFVALPYVAFAATTLYALWLMKSGRLLNTGYVEPIFGGKNDEGQHG